MPISDALVVGDLLVRPARSFAHRQHVAVPHREAAECPVDEFAVDCGQDQILGGVADHRAHQLRVVGGRTARASPQHVGADVPGDHGEPRVEALVTGETGQRLPGSGESLLRRVLGLVAVAEAPHAEAEQPLVVAGVEIAERRGVTRLRALDQLAVALEVDVVAKTRQPLFAERHLPSLPLQVLLQESRQSACAQILLGSSIPSTGTMGDK